MINHVRNFIINLKADPQVERPPWDRFSPDEFQPLRLAADLEFVRALLTGPNDYWDRSFRAEHILSVVGSPRYKNHVSFFDTRATKPEQSIFAFVFNNVLTPVNAAAQSATATALIKYGEPADTTPVRRAWRVTWVDPTRIMLQNGVQTWYREFNASNVATIDTDIGFSVDPAQFIVNALWSVTSYTHYTPLATTFELCKTMPSLVRDRLFRSVKEGDKDWLADLKRWYQDSRFESDVLAAVALSFVHQASNI